MLFISQLIENLDLRKDVDLFCRTFCRKILILLSSDVNVNWISIAIVQDIPSLADAAALEHPGISYLVTAPLGLHEKLVV